MKKIKYISVKEAAKRWSVTPRRVQQLCKEGQIKGTERLGRTWLIPEETQKPEQANNKYKEECPYPIKKLESFMPLTASAFPLGKCKEYINFFPKEEQDLLWAEYYYFSGQAEVAVTFAEPFLNHCNLKKKLTAFIIYGFASLSLGHINSVRFAFNNIKEIMNSICHKKIDEFTKAVCIYASTMSSVLLHLPDMGIPPLENSIRYLPKGLKLYACYILAHQSYIQKNYEKALGIAETALAWYSDLYPISVIYLHLIAAVNAMNIKQIEKAKEHFNLAWEIASFDDLIEGIGEHHGLLQGLIEVMIKTENLEDYQRVISITYSFSKGWRKIHNPDTNREVADDLTTTEFTIAMLADRGWSYQEIADHMKLSPNTVSKYLSYVYQRLGIKTKEELHDYMLY